jgi:serine/threonine-protein kinase
LPRPYGKYELLERIGAGGMAEVYRARLGGVAGFEKIVVIKRILPHLAQQKAIAEMFIEEAKIAARVHHRNIVQVFELGALEDGELFIAMEYVAGTDLSVLLRHSVKRKLRIPVWFSLHVISEVLAGLATAHEMVDEQGRPLNVVHRDVTPSNLFISYVGDIKLGDFGVAQSALKVQQTRTGELKGKVAYMAPEQLYGRPLDARADVFAAGVVLWECLTQRRLFGGRPEIETMNAICTGERIPPSRYDNSIPPELDAIVLAAIEADRDVRIQSAGELMEMLSGILPRFAARVLQADVRYVVEVLTGQVSPDTPGALTPPAREAVKPRLRTSSIATKSFIETTPSLRPRPYQLPPGAKSEPPPSPAAEAYVSPSQIVLSRAPPEQKVPEAAIDPQVPGASTAWPIGGPDVSVDIAVSDDVVIEFTDEGASADVAPQAEESWLFAKNDMPGVVSVSDQRAQVLADTPPWATVGTQPAPRAASDNKPVKRDGGYRGPHPFWLQNEAQMIWGPCDYGVIRRYLASAHERAGHTFRIAAYQTPWVDLDIFASLTGQELFRGGEPLPKKGFFNGSLRSRSLASVLASIGAARSTGRLVIVGEDPHRPPRREIHVLEGVPTYIATDSPKLQLPELLARRALITAESGPAIMHEVLYRLEPIESVAVRHAGVSLEEHYSLLMRERAGELFYWRTGNYAFDHEFVPARTTPVARSLFTLVASAIARTKTEEELRQAAAAWGELKLAPTDRLSSCFRELSLSDEQAVAARQLWEGTPLSALLKRFPAEQRTYLVVAYVLVETGLVAPSSASGGR